MVIDRPVDQVLIESRIVIATDTFARELGAKFGISGSRDNVLQRQPGCQCRNPQVAGRYGAGQRQGDSRVAGRRCAARRRFPAARPSSAA